jgi:hypothetical protein
MQIPTGYIPSFYPQMSYTGLHGGAPEEARYDGCETCDNRAYQDKSSDSSVSMQTPTKMNPAEAAQMVRAHEMEHIRNDKIDAESSGREVLWQSVRLHYDICRECGVTYVAGGEATTASVGGQSLEERFNPGAESLIGDLLDEVA